MDNTREKDLYDLDTLRKDVTKPMLQRKLAHKSFEKIQSQLRDPYITRQRSRLIKARQAQDRVEVWKITNQLKDYLHEPTIPFEDMTND